MQVMRVATVLLLLLQMITYAAEGVPHWEQVVDEVLERARQVPSVPAPTVEQPPATHPLVEEFIRYFQTNGAGAWSTSLRRLTAMRSMIEATLEQEGIPHNLMWLGVVESGYRAEAVSPKNAAGIWQFMPETARRFGLNIDRKTDRNDERLDAVKSTRAAARYLRFLYQMFGDWQLALAAYNAGEARVQAAIDASGSKDFWKLAERGLLPRETRAYVPAVLAAQLLGESKQAALPGGKRGSVEAPFSLAP